MKVDAIREFCLAFPGAKENLQWGDDLCFKVRGKIFAILGLDHPRLCCKCTPESFAELTEREDIRPAPYVGRYQWVMLYRLDAVRRDELEELIRTSYEMVAVKAGKKVGKRKKFAPGMHIRRIREDEILFPDRIGGRGRSAHRTAWNRVQFDSACRRRLASRVRPFLDKPSTAWDSDTNH